MNSWDKYDLDDFAKIFFNELLADEEYSLRESYHKAYADLRKKINVAEETARYSRENGWDDMVYIWSLSGFILAVSLDLKISTEGLIFSKDYGKKEFYIKNSCVIIYEFLEDIEQLLGKTFYDFIKTYKIRPGLIDELNEKKKSLSNIKKEHNQSLKNIRSIIGAHRDHNFLIQIETMKQLKDVAFLHLISIFDKALNELSIPLQGILNESIIEFISFNKQQQY